MPANSCKHRFYFYNLLPEILLPESLPEGKPSGREGYLLSEIIVHDALRINSQRIQIICNGLDQHWRSAEIVLAILWCLVILQVGVTDAVNSKTLVVLHALSICHWVLAVQ